MIVVDTGVLYAVADAADADHDAADSLLTSYDPAEFVVPVPVVVESSWLIESRLGPAAEAGFLDSVVSGELRTAELTTGDWSRVAELVAIYADMRLGIVDASVVAIAERLGITTIATLDRRHFAVVRPGHVEAFEVIP